MLSIGGGHIYIAKKIRTLPKEEKEIYRKLNPEERISRDDRANYKYISSLMERSPKFMLKTSASADLYNSATLVVVNSSRSIECGTALFSQELIALCLEKLTSFIDEFQLTALPQEEKVSVTIDRYNSSHRQKLPKADMIQFYDLLVKYGSFREVARLSRYSKATLYRYKDRFKKIGITENNIKPGAGFVFPKAALNLNDYHDFLSKISITDGKRVTYPNSYD